MTFRGVTRSLARSSCVVFGGAVAGLALLVAIFVEPASAQEIHDFQSDVTVERDGSILVVETIKAEILYIDEHGIYRDIPVREAGTWLMRSTPVQVLTVTRDGASEAFEPTIQPGEHPFQRLLHLRIGRPDVVLAQGNHLWRVTYRIERKVLAGGTERLRYDATGESWPSGIMHASVTTHLPVAAVPSATTSAPGYVESIGAGSVTVATSAGLENGQGLKVSLAWPGDDADAPSARAALETMLTDNWPPAATLGGLALFGGLCWLLRARKALPVRVPPPSPALPLGLSAAAARFIDGMGYDLRAASTAILDLASLGRIAIGRRFERYVLVEQDRTAPVEPDEAQFADLLFVDGKPRELSGDDHLVLTTASRGLQKALEDGLWSRCFETDRARATAIRLSGIAVLLASPVFFLLGESDKAGWLILVCYGLTAGIVGFFLSLGRSLGVKNRREPAVWFLGLGFGIFFVGLLVVISLLDSNIPALWAITLGGALPIATILPMASRLMTSRTPEGLRLQAEIHALRCWLIAQAGAKSDRETAADQLRPRHLAFAVALGLKTKAIAHFATKVEGGIDARPSGESVPFVGDFDQPWSGAATHLHGAFAAAFNHGGGDGPGGDSGGGGGGDGGGGGTW